MLKQELEGRIKRLAESLDQHELDCFIVTSEDGIWYLTNVTYQPEERPFFIVVTADMRPCLVVPKLEEEHLRKVMVDCDIVSYWEYPSPSGQNWYDVLEGVLSGRKRIGVEGSIKLEIMERISGGEVIPADLVSKMREVKSAFEVQMIRESAKVSVRAMGDIFKNAYDGASAVEIFSLSRSVQTDLIRSKSFDPIVTSLLTAAWPAPISSMPHSIPELGDKLNRGPNVAMCYFRINGYASECERTFFIGEPTDESREHFHHMMKAREKALSVVKPGVRCSDVDTEARTYLLANGYGDNLLHRTGHGIGLGNHEAPWIAEGSDQILEENMVISIEPGIYIDDIGGFRHSDTVLVTDCGYELLTKFPVDIDNMTIRNAGRFARLKGSIIKKTLNL